MDLLIMHQLRKRHIKSIDQCNASGTHCRGHQTSPAVVRLKDGLPQLLQSKSTFSWKIIQMHSLFRHDFLNHKTEIENGRILFLCDGFRKIGFCIDLIPTVFDGRYKHKIVYLLLLFSFTSFISLKNGNKKKAADSC